jgi:REP element-mobilizing transposase RayT
MPRGPRVDFPGAVHHVYARGIEKRPIYLDDVDRKSFLDRIGNNLPKWGMRCLAWSLMPNHFHLLLQSDKGCLPSFMHCLLTGYSMRFNERHQRVGHLFQNRYKSPLVCKDGYFRDVVRYIHLNPVRSEIVRSIRDLEEYPWTGHRHIIRGGPPVWQDTGLLQTEFDDPRDVTGWVRRYRGYIEKVPEGTFQAYEGEDGASECDAGLPGTIGLQEYRKSESYKVFADLLQRIAATNGVPATEVLGGGRGYTAVRARRELLRECKSRLNISTVQLSRWLGVSQGAARYLLNSENCDAR